MNKTITVHTLVQNEEKYLWFSVMSVIDFVDKVFIWDTGSTDKTIEIIKEIQRLKPEKVYFKEVGKVNPDEFTKVRQKMLNETKTDWLILVDGDEVWWEDSIKKVISIIVEKGNNLDSIACKYKNLIGDIYHFQNERAGKYKIDEKMGFFNIRAINMKIGGLKVSKPHGQQGYFNEANILIQNMNKMRRVIVDNSSYLHFTNLSRSSGSFDLKVPKRKQKYKYELGKPFPLDFYYPEVFFRPRPMVVDNPWNKRDVNYLIRSAVETPLKEIKRKFFRNRNSGY